MVKLFYRLKNFARRLSLGGTKPLIRMNSKDGGNFCGSKLHKFCWDFVGTCSFGSWSDRLKTVEAAMLFSQLPVPSAIVTSTTDSEPEWATATVGRPYARRNIRLKRTECPSAQPRLMRDLQGTRSCLLMGHENWFDHIDFAVQLYYIIQVIGAPFSCTRTNGLKHTLTHPMIV